MDTLFLDRDGVINIRKPGKYISRWMDFHYTEKALLAIVECSKIFQRIIVVTNQQGIGKQLMTEEALISIHTQLLKDVAEKGGNIAAIYYCPHLANTGCDCRKPNIGMGRKAVEDFPDINFSQSVMVGDSRSDMEFGHRLGMQNILILGKGEYVPESLFAFACDNLWDFWLKKSKLK